MHCQLRRLAWHWYLLLYFYERDCPQQCWLKYEMKAEMKRKAVNTGLPSCLCVCLPYLLSQFVFQVPQCVVFLPKFFTWTSSYDPICFTGTRTLMRTRIVCVGHSEKSSWESRCSSCLFSVALDQALHLWRLFSYFCKKKKYSEESNEIRLELGPVNRIRKNCNSLKTCNAMWELRSRKSSRQSSKKRGDTSLEFLNQRWPCMCLRDDLLPERADAVFTRCSSCPLLNSRVHYITDKSHYEGGKTWCWEGEKNTAKRRRHVWWKADRQFTQEITEQELRKNSLRLRILGILREWVCRDV